MSVKQTKKQQRIIDIHDIPSTPLAYLWYVTKPFKWWAFGGVMVVLVASLLDEGLVYFFKLIIDAIETGDKEIAVWYVLLYPVGLLVMNLLYRASGLVGLHWETSTKKYSYDSLSKHILQHSHSYFTSRFAGSLMSKINNVTNAIDQLIPEILWSYIPTLVGFLITFGFMVSADVTAGMLFVALVVVMVIFNRLLAPTKARHSKEAAEAGTKFRGYLTDIIANVQAVRQYVRDRQEVLAVDALTTDLRLANAKNWLYSEKMLLANSVILFIFSFGMFWSLARAWQADTISTGSMVFLLVLYSQMTGSILFIGRMFNRTAQAVGEMREGLEELMVPFEVVDAPGAKGLVVEQAGIDLLNVSFDFDGKLVFDGFDLRIASGQRLGLVGQSGAGKSTFVSLLMRQHDIAGGQILIDGQNIAEITQDSLREAIAVVPQEPLLFHRTIRENILYGNPHATEAEVIEVAKKAQAHEFIMTLPDGYDTMVGERGVKLSGGQKQRVAIARAMLKDAPILVLDEATSALDSESEVEIQKALEALMEGRTVIAIAHRLSTLRKMDRIIVLESGKIVEDGSHDVLAAGDGVYARLWNHQAGGFLQDGE